MFQAGVLLPKMQDRSSNLASVDLTRDMVAQQSCPEVVPVLTKELPTRNPVENFEPEAVHVDGEVDVDLGLWEEVSEHIVKASSKIRVPRQLMLSGTIEDGSRWSAATTAADGACALHSIWGEVVEMLSSNTFFLEQAREKICDQIPTDLSLLCDVRLGVAVRDWLDRVRNDLVEHAMRLLQDDAEGDASGTQVIWSYLPDVLSPEMRDFAKLKLVERDAQKTLSRALLRAAEPLFVEEHRALLQQLCVELKYIEDDMLEALGEIQADVDMNPLEWF